MALIQLMNVDYSVGGPLLLERTHLSIDRNERICIVGRNGAGKSTLLRLIDREIQPDDGEIRYQTGLVVARMAQEVPQGTTGSVFDVIARGLGELGQLLTRYHQALDTGDMATMGDIQADIEARQGWDLDQRVVDVLAQLNLEGDTDFQSLSGGMKRRVLLGQALVQKPDVLLLDEPTNHLDIDAIDWLENFLKSIDSTLLFVTHDRRFLRQLATRIVEINRGEVTDWPGDYDNYLRRREERAHAEAKANADFDRKLAQEEAWIRQGIKARRTRNEGRVRALKAMRVARAKRREQEGTTKMQLTAGKASGKKVITAEHIHHGFDGRVLIDDFNTQVMRGDRIGIIGANGAGKSTLIKILLGKLSPQQGQITLGSNLEVAYFDQHRAQLNNALNALDNVAQGREYIELNNKRMHIIGYLQNFLFTPERARAPITRLSGGERNRLLLAKLFAQPSNMLVMDEPTNDLDVETLELLEELLSQYKGTLLLVSHDREFMDNVITSTLALEGNGRIGEYVGGYSDWLRQRPAPHAMENARQKATKPATKVAQTPAKPLARRKKLSYKDQRELDQLPERIEQLEMAIGEHTEAMTQPDFYKQSDDAIVQANQKLEALQQSLDNAYSRWAELDEQS